VQEETQRGDSTALEGVVVDQASPDVLSDPVRADSARRVTADAHAAVARLSRRASPILQTPVTLVSLLDEGRW
jgi:hypothetical protein